MNKYVFDTSFIVSFFNEKDSNHQEALKMGDKIKNEYITIPSVVLSEIISFNKNKKLRDEIVQNTLDTIDEISSLTDENILEYLHFTGKIETAFTAIDSIILYSAISTDSELITLDKKLNKLYQKLK